MGGVLFKNVSDAIQRTMEIKPWLERIQDRARIIRDAEPKHPGHVVTSADMIIKYVNEIKEVLGIE